MVVTIDVFYPSDWLSADAQCSTSFRAVLKKSNIFISNISEQKGKKNVDHAKRNREMDAVRGIFGPPWTRAAHLSVACVTQWCVSVLSPSLFCFFAFDQNSK